VVRRRHVGDRALSLPLGDAQADGSSARCPTLVQVERL
jgi:hypothetical protein